MNDITSFPIPTQVFNPDDFAGADGREVELQSTVTHIQWRYAGETAWVNLVAKADLEGPQGPQGLPGDSGPKGDPGDTGPQGEQGPQGEAGIQGPAGDPGADGHEVELQSTATHIQWRYAGETAWVNLVAKADLEGPQGPQGLPGDSGPKGDPGDTGPQGEQGPQGEAGIQGPAGDPGADGREVELQSTATHIQWRYAGETAWVNLVAKADLEGLQGPQGLPGEPGPKGDPGDTGPQGEQGPQGEAGIQGPAGDPGADGREVELQSTATHIQWRYAGETAWVNLIAKEDLEPSELGEEAIQQVRTAFEIFVPDPLRRSVESASGGKCTVEYTANQQPCFMHVIPKLRWEDLLPGQQLGTGVHEAFIANGVEKSELLVGMYMAAEINSEMVSQPRTTGRRSINWDQSVAAAQASGFELFGNWEWSAVALWCMANGFQPRGNTDFGKSHSHTHERGVYDADSVSNEYTLLGSGPNAWSHNNSPNGIADLVGNRWEWVWGFKMVDGRIIIAPDNDRALAESGWVDSGYDLPSDANPWSSLTQAGATQQVRRALIVPNGSADPDGRLYANLSGERFPIRGGSRGNGAFAGLAALNLGNARSGSGTAIGLRLSRLV